ncbi:hypothetical protein ACFXDJ_21695 [Streptomyces sp. NPDC059443]|uniref:hypothetical protein n=1 Tax=unclassified Streptomyces TaxID=2593676 RepID=UPI0036C1F584
MKITRLCASGALVGAFLLIGGAPAQAADNPLLSLLDNLSVKDVSLSKILNPNVILSQGGTTTLHDAAEPLLAKPAAAPAAPAAAPAAAPVAAPAAPPRTIVVQAAPVMPGATQGAVARTAP